MSASQQRRKKADTESGEKAAGLDATDEGLRTAAMMGDADKVASLLAEANQAAGAPKLLDINSADDHGLTALLYAVIAGHPKCVAALLEAGADKAREDVSGCTALDWARDEGRDDIVKLLE